MADGKKEPRKNDLQRTADLGFTLPKKQDAGSNYYVISVIHFYGSCWNFLVDQYWTICRWLIVIVLDGILLFIQIDFLCLCVQLICGIDLGEFGLIFKYLKWLMTRTEEYRKHDL